MFNIKNEAYAKFSVAKNKTTLGYKSCKERDAFAGPALWNIITQK
jgi:hypothetical protein